jgi:hypothetical protein
MRVARAEGKSRAFRTACARRSGVIWPSPRTGDPITDAAAAPVPPHPFLECGANSMTPARPSPDAAELGAGDRWLRVRIYRGR